MDSPSTQYGLALIPTGAILCLGYLFFKSRQQGCRLSQKLQLQQQLMARVFADIHNGPLQQLPVLIRELQRHKVPQQDLVDSLRDVYQSVQTGVENLNSE